jgi:hypothetical protein
MNLEKKNTDAPIPFKKLRRGGPIEVFDQENNQTTFYDSMNEAARALNIQKQIITTYFKNNQVKLYGEAGRYTFALKKVVP